MAKTKRMFMGGAANAAMQSVKSAPKTGPAPQMPPRGMPPRGMPPQVGTAGRPPMPPPPMPPQGMAGMQGIGQAMRGQQANMPPPQGGMGGMAGMQAKFGPPSVASGAPKTMGGMGMKSGGTASSRADGCATKGKTKGRFV